MQPMTFYSPIDDVLHRIGLTSRMTERLPDSNYTGDTGQSWSSGPSVTLGKIPLGKYDAHSQVDILQPLPSHKLRFSVWHDLRQTCLSGDQLHAPRVRDGPADKEQMFYKLEEDGQKLHHNLKGKARMNHMDTFENWEGAKVINLSYQELHHDYQKKNLRRILQRCKSAESVNLVHNELTTLAGINFPACQYLNINDNFLTAFSHLPNAPRLRVLTASGNPINVLHGLKGLASCLLEELTLKGTPISFNINYRQNIFAALPNLRVLDGIPKLASDSVFQEDETANNDNSGCTIL